MLLNPFNSCTNLVVVRIMIFDFGRDEGKTEKLKLKSEKMDSRKDYDF